MGRNPPLKVRQAPYRCWASLWRVWTGTVRTWRSPVCTSSCSSSLLLAGGGGRGLGKVSTKYPRRTFTLTKSRDDSVLVSPALRRLCQRGPCVCVWRQWWSWVSGERWGGLVLRVCGWAPLVRCSGVSLSVWLTQCSFFCQVINICLPAVYLLLSGEW